VHFVGTIIVFSTIIPRRYVSKFKLQLGSRPVPLFGHSGKSCFEEGISTDVWEHLVTPIVSDQEVLDMAMAKRSSSKLSIG
jgi:hypothetical protein